MEADNWAIPKCWDLRGETKTAQTKRLELLEYI